jgi:DNA-binding NarL/FixJ family response regulator
MKCPGNQKASIIMRKIRILIIEDNRVLRDGISVMLNEQSDMVAEAVTRSSKSDLLKKSAIQPRVILLDGGLENFAASPLLASIRDIMPEAKMIGMGLSPSQSDIAAFVEAGVSGFILKDATVGEFLETIRLVAKGEKVLPPSMTASLFSHVIELTINTKKEKATNVIRMTKREREVMAQIAEGLNNKEIAIALNIAAHTVKSHVHNIMEKLALHSRLQILKFLSNQDW